jgi:hypothetical protein
MFIVNYTLSRPKAMLTACQMKRAITYNVKIFYPISQRNQNVYFHRCVIFYLKISKSLIKL